MKDKKPPNPHDTFTKEVLSNIHNAVDFFRGILPEEIGALIDLSTLTQDKTTFTDETLAEYFSDLVFTCTYRGRPMKLVLLFEHKSFIPDFPYYQLLRYITNIWYEQMKDKKPLPIVLPIIFYHGKRPWKRKSLSEYLAGGTVQFQQFIPEFDYLLVDLSEFTEEEITSVLFRRTAVKLWLLVQKYIFYPLELKSNLKKIFLLGILYFSGEEGLRFLESLLRYVLFSTDIPEDTVMDSVEVLPIEAKEKAMTTAERLINKGREEGIQKGISTGTRKTSLENARKMMDKGYPLKDICEITGLSEEEVRELQEERE